MFFPSGRGPNRRAPVLLFILLSMVVPGFSDGQSLVLGGMGGEVASLSFQILRQAYARMGIAVVREILPPYRSLKMADEGHVDGELCRIGGMSAQFPHLRQVPVPLAWLEEMALAREPETEVATLSDLSRYRVVVPNRKQTIAMTQGMQRTLVGRDHLMFYMLQRDRADVGLFDRLTALGEMRKRKISDLYLIEPPLVRRPLFHYLHARHEPLLASLTAELQKLEAEGVIRDMNETVLRRYVQDGEGKK